MYNSRKKPLEETPVEMTAIWSCTSETCNCWMRDNFALDAEPTCPQCQSEMVRGEKSLAVIVNSSFTHNKEG
ncbi:cold-shock protein [Paenibacillus gansuensis]|uniref:Cold-shock protein n=1 Tax=Paenibacillus gansuensis TaxID=306542 RepID=A0ABW5PHC7_9BACL